MCEGVGREAVMRVNLVLATAKLQPWPCDSFIFLDIRLVI